MTGRYAVMIGGPPELPVSDRIMVADRETADVWFTVRGDTMMDALAEGSGRWLADLRDNLGAVLPDSELVCMAPASWLRGRVPESEVKALDFVVRHALALAEGGLTRPTLQ